MSPAALDADVLVVGGGPVGLATAIETAERGLATVVLDHRSGPVDKACGEGLMPAALARLARLAVAPAGRPYRGITYRGVGSDAAGVTALFSHGHGLGVRRTTLSAALQARADAAGVTRLTRRAEPPRQAADWVGTAGLRARWLVAADGLHSPTRRALGLAVPGAPARRRVGLRAHYRLAPWSDTVEVTWAADAEAYVTPVAEDTVGVAVLGSGPAEPFERWLDRFPELRERLTGAERVSTVRGAGPLRQRVRHRVAGRVLLVGDAAGYVDALTGEGIAVGLACASAVAQCVHEQRPQDYEQRWRAATRR